MTYNYENRLSGVFAPLITPFKNQEVDFQGLISNIKKYNKTNLKGYFILGTNGEFKSLSIEERLKIIEITVEHTTKDKEIIACTSEESTVLTKELSLKAIELGVDFISLLMPNFFSKYITTEVMTDYIKNVSEISTIPVLLYNNPSVANGVLINEKVIHNVKSYENVIGMKDSSKGNIKRFIKISEKDQFHLIAGSASFFYEALENGAVGGVLSLANVFPDKCAELYDLFRSGQTEKAKILNNEIQLLNKEVSGYQGVASVKKAMECKGFTGGLPRKPLNSLNTNEEDKLKEKICNINL